MAEEKKVVGWRCTVCGYEHNESELPEGFVCPLCGVPAEMFEAIEE